MERFINDFHAQVKDKFKLPLHIEINNKWAKNS